MKVYKRKHLHTYAYPEDMKLILYYLNKHGEILVNYTTIESLYFVFSYDKYDAVWMEVNEQILQEFEEWLENYEY